MAAKAGGLAFELYNLERVRYARTPEGGGLASPDNNIIDEVPLYSELGNDVL